LENGQDRARRRVLKVYTIVEKADGQKGIWLEIGIASENRDGSISAKLDALPVNGSIHIREYESRKSDNGRRSIGEQQPPAGWHEGGTR
jgi:hypothetical protein